ncbi:MAG: peptidoglycan-binding protein [Clostridia bacterium]|nr:peptidoglycan-binding protein [Clostridia bacterium]
MTVRSEDLVFLFQKAYQEGWGYIYGKRGQTWTASAQRAASRAQTVRYGSRWVGRRVADCSGLFVWAFAELGGGIYHGSDTIWRKYCAERGKLMEGRRADGRTLRPGTALFLKRGQKRSHIGLYIGHGLAIEARSTKEGVRLSDAQRWDEWGELSGVEYPLTEAAPILPPLYPALRKGDAGVDVVALQNALTLIGYPLEADGLFGKRTEAAVRVLQRDRSLKTDGVCGPRTWNIINAMRTSATERKKET